MRWVLLLAVVLLLSGCGDERHRWTGAPAGADPVAVFLPVDLGPLAADAQSDPEQPARWAAEAAGRLRLRAGLPPTNSRWTAAWSATAPAAGAPAAVVSLRLASLEDRGPDGWLAAAEVVVADAAGRPLWRSRATGAAEAERSPKIISPDARPDRAAARAALRGCADEVAGWCARRQDAAAIVDPVAPAPAPAAEIAIDIASDPSGADVLVDGVFKGTTPCTLRLPAAPVRLRIERGSLRWERTFTPEPGMRIAPALAPAAP